VQPAGVNQDNAQSIVPVPGEKDDGYAAAHPREFDPPREGATPRTDALLHERQCAERKSDVWDVEDVEAFLKHARQLERELADTQRRFAEHRKLNAALGSLPSATAPHWVYAAAEAHYPLVVRVSDGRTHYARDHLTYMLNEICNRAMSPTKACRWLGWVQASLCFAGIATLDELKAINKAATDKRRKHEPSSSC
jgi:hypothetical protein